MTGKELRTVRDDWGLTQREMARLLTYTEQQVSKMERGEAKVPEIIERYVYLEQKLRFAQFALYLLLTSLFD